LAEGRVSAEKGEGKGRRGKKEGRKEGKKRKEGKRMDTVPDLSTAWTMVLTSRLI
jgi:hypothetical protein